ncbi:unnamed protein product [Cyclocybe aegerita]|uniref:Uncharacterized protein n=1 Tax=Cyclocybe aegerita TaxID=1973307 RepID=A0A8S0WPH5_CYCAE|nr:unnamed protein product [Cyclocybe aegerita]
MELIDFNRFVWRTDDKIPGRYLREAGGGEVIEDMWKLTKHGEQNLFLGVYADLSTPLEADSLFDHVRKAWKSLRWEVPTLAATTSHVWHEDKPPTTFIVYDVGISDVDVDLWINETVEMHLEYKDRTLDDLRYDFGQVPIPVNDYDRQTFLYLVPYSPTKFGLLIRTAHTTFDGAGIKILMTKLLMHLEKYVSDATEYTREQDALMRWGTEGERLLPIVTEILRKHEPAVVDDRGVVLVKELPAEVREGKEYFECLADVMNGLVSGIPRAHRFKSFIEPPFDSKTTMPKTRRLQHTFTVEESKKIQAAGAVPDDPIQKLTVNHLVLGALCLLPLIDNPPPPNTDALVFYYGLVDGRPRLDKKYRGSLDYPGYCLGMSGLHIPASIFHQHPIEDKKALVLDFAKAVKKEYAKQAAYTSLVAIEPQQGDLMMNGPAPPPWSGPLYSADGKGAVYLHPRYPAEGKPVIEITDFFLGLNKCDPGPFFRCSEWRGRIMLSVDFNELAVDVNVVQGWMNLWAELLLSVAVEETGRDYIRPGQDEVRQGSRSSFWSCVCM